MPAAGDADQLRWADRSATVGRLAGAFVHDIGTPLSVIIGRAAILAESTSPSHDQLLDSTRRISDHANRIAQMAQRFLAFARPLQSEPSLAPLLPEVRSIVELLEPWAKKSRVRASIADGGEGIAAKVDPSGFQQAVANLLTNAVQAMPDGGEISIALSRSEDGSEVGVEVADMGPGVPDTDRERIFDLFFTTKPRCAGIGLTVAKEIAESYHGKIVVGRSQSGGASFTFLLPAEGS